MNADHAGSEFFIVLATVGPFWLTVILITTTCVYLSYRRRSRERELGAEMIREMLSRKMIAEEIERVMFAWSGRRKPLNKYLANAAPSAPVQMSAQKAAVGQFNVAPSRPA